MEVRGKWGAIIELHFRSKSRSKADFPEHISGVGNRFR